MNLMEANGCLLSETNVMKQSTLQQGFDIFSRTEEVRENMKNIFLDGAQIKLAWWSYFAMYKGGDS